MASRLALRRVLATPSLPVSAWQLSAEVGRAPQVISALHNSAPSQPLLSLAHSRNLVLSGSAPRPLGVDIEVLPFKRPRDITGMAHMVCSAQEQASLAHLDGSGLQQAFVNLWVLKEAFFKYQQTGLDLARIQKISCCARCPPQEAGEAVAHAWLWHGRMGQDQHITWALCMDVLPSLSEIEMELDDSMQLLAVQPWVLCEAK